MSKFEELRQKHKCFVYYDYELTGGKLRFHFGMDDFHFYPEWSFESDLLSEEYDRSLVSEIAFSLGMAELVSYWKCACPPKVEVRCGSLSEYQKQWWKKLYFNGLAEFFYRNGIEADFESFMTISAPEAPKKSFHAARLDGVMTPIGGGKDSVVSVEILKSANARIIPYIINARGATLGCVEAAGISCRDAVCPHRTIDKTLLELNKRGYLNGHTPFSAVVAFSSLLFGTLKGAKYIALSNESSANEAYVEGTKINHQYSKSTEFEHDFREYCKISFGGFKSCSEYFSLLRPLTEWQIAREFVKYPAYFRVFQSCNLGSKTNIWCCNCAKCLYVYILLAAFLDDGELEGIFGCDMLQKTELMPMLDGLMLNGEDKPFECVGSKDEVRLSLKMAADRRKDCLPPLLEHFNECLPDFKPVDLSRYFDKDNFVPENFLMYVERAANGY